jgi:hypothetical protein
MAATPGPSVFKPPDPIPVGLAVAVALGYHTVGDGGGGQFYWDASSLAQPDSGTIFEAPLHGPRGRWIRLDSGPLNVRWFGAYGDGINDDSTAINTAITAATTPVFGIASDGTNRRVIRPGSATVYFPPGIYSVRGPLTLGPQHSGMTLRGATDGGQLSVSDPGSSSASGVASIIRLRQPASSLLQVSTTVLRVEDLWFDGNQQADATVRFISKRSGPPLPNVTSVVTDIIFSRVIVTGAAPPKDTDQGSGALVRFSGDSEIDELLFTRCQIRQSILLYGLLAEYCVSNIENQQAAGIHFEHCVLSDATSIGAIRSGACLFRHCQVFRAPTAVFTVEIAHNTIIEDCYIEDNCYTTADDLFTGPPAPTGASGAQSGSGDFPVGTYTFVLTPWDGRLNLGLPTSYTYDPGHSISSTVTVNVTTPGSGIAVTCALGAGSVGFALWQLIDGVYRFVEPGVPAGFALGDSFTFTNPATPGTSATSSFVLLKWNGPFLYMPDTVGESGSVPIVVRNCELNATTASLVLNCKQPVILDGNLFKANVYISQAPEPPPPVPPYTYSPVVSIANSFGIPGTGFTGGIPGGAPSPIPAGMLIEVAGP